MIGFIIPLQCQIVYGLHAHMHGILPLSADQPVCPYICLTLIDDCIGNLSNFVCLETNISICYSHCSAAVR